VACDLNVIVKGKGLLKVTGSNVDWKIGNILETVLDTAYLIAAIVMILSVFGGNSIIASLFKCDISYLWRVARSLCICIALCLLSCKRLKYPFGKNIVAFRFVFILLFVML